jgi:hypothetical protein
MHARSWFVLAAVGALVCTSGCGSCRWGSRRSRLPMPNPCVESSCDDPTCELCSPLPPLYDGMARNHRLNRRALRGHGDHRRGRHGHGGCSCGHCGGEWFDGEIIDGEIIDGGCFPCSSCDMGCTSCDGMVIDGGMPMEMMSGGCPTCQHQGTYEQSMMPSGSIPNAPPAEPNHYEPQPTPANSAPKYSPGAEKPAPSSTVPSELPMTNPMPMTPAAEPMSRRSLPNYGVLFSAAPGEPQAGSLNAAPLASQPEPPAPPLASPTSHQQLQLIAPPQHSSSLPPLPAPAGASSEVYTAEQNPIQLQSGTRVVPAPVTPGRKPLRPFSEAAKPRNPQQASVAGQLPPGVTMGPPATPGTAPRPVAKAPQLTPPAEPAGKPQWEATLSRQPIEQAGGLLPPLPSP